MSERLRPTADVLPTRDMESMRVQLHRFNVMASYRDLEPRGDTTAIELFITDIQGWEAWIRQWIEPSQPQPES